MSEKDVIDEIRKTVKAYGSMRALAREWQVTPSYISDLLKGRRVPGPKILSQLGLRAVRQPTIYVRVM